MIRSQTKPLSAESTRPVAVLESVAIDSRPGFQLEKFRLTSFRSCDVGGWRLHLNCTGEARPSQAIVILEAGAGDFSVDWSLVQPSVAPVNQAAIWFQLTKLWLHHYPDQRHQQLAVVAGHRRRQESNRV